MVTPSESKRRWRENNKVRAHAMTRAWEAKNRDRVRETCRKSYWRNVEKRRTAMLEKQRKFPEKFAAANAMRKAKKRLAVPGWANKFFMQEAYHLAQLRTKIMGHEWHVDHVIPLISDSVCGLHTEHNLRVMQARANISKGNRHWPDMP